MKIVLFILVAAFFTSCNTDNGVKPVDEARIAKTAEKLVQADNEFGIDLFKKVYNSFSPEDNVFISPVSAAFALAMTYNGANGETRTAMELALKKEGLDINNINQSYKDLMDGLASADPLVTLNIANSIWCKDSFYVLPDFVEANNTYYNAEVKLLDFEDQSSIDVINGWVAEKTKGKIQKIINQIGPMSMMFLINAIYFNGKWKTEFKESDTRPVNFYPEKGTRFLVDMMGVTGTFNYYSNKTFKALELLFGNGNYSMVVLLPEGENKTENIINELTPQNWDSWIGSLTEKEVIVNLPKFKFEFEDSLNNELDAMGMGIAFTDNADFTRINPFGNLRISMVKQKSYIDVNEKGTEAAAATVVEMELTSAGPEKTYFNADKPFLFVIMEKRTKSIVFIGRVAKPEYEN